MKALRISTAVIAVLMLVSDFAQAQSNKYQRPGKKAAAVVAPAAGTAAPAAPAKDAKAVDPKSEKVDIQQIENDYWQSKDSEFHVVQSRRYSKEKRPFMNLGFGPLINDNFNKGFQYSLSGGYFYKEQTGVEVFYDRFTAENSKVTKEVLNLSGGPTYARPKAQYGVTWNWMPIYGKVSVFDKSIIYFDMGLHMGVGMAEYAPMRETGVATKISREASIERAPMIILDVSQQFFLSEKWAVRFDLKNRFYQQKLINFKSPYDSKKTDTEHSVEAVLGFTYYFH
jgi:outer membrane beta-barrel protein